MWVFVLIKKNFNARFKLICSAQSQKIRSLVIKTHSLGFKCPPYRHKNNSSYSSSPPATNIKSRNICHFHKSFIFLLSSLLGLCVSFRCLFLPDRWGSSWDCQHAEPSYQLAQTFPTFPPADDTETTVKVSAADTDPLLCAGPAHLWVHLTKPGSETQRLGVEGWRDKQKLVNKNIFPPLQWDFSYSLSGTERGSSRLNELGGYGRFNPQQVHQTSTKPE